MNISIGNFLGDLASSTTAFTSSMSGVFTLVLGIMFAFWIISFVVGLFTGENDDNIGG